MFYYISKCLKAGIFIIRKQSENSSHWDLYLNDVILGSYITPELAANAVYRKITNEFDWHKIICDSKIPQNLSDWKRIEENLKKAM